MIYIQIVCEKPHTVGSRVVEYITKHPKYIDVYELSTGEIRIEVVNHCFHSTIEWHYEIIHFARALVL